MGVAVLAVIAALSLAASAQAHSPYFKDARPIVLPDGSSGEVRILVGDGIIMPDPNRLVILDASGRLLALGPRGGPIALICTSSRGCKGYDLIAETVFEPDSGGFAGQDIRVSSDRGDDDDLWGLESRTDSFGVTSRAPILDEWLLSEWYVLHRLRWLSLGPLLFGLLGGVAFIRIGALWRPSFSGAMAWAILTVGRLLFFASFFFLGFLHIVMVEMKILTAAAVFFASVLILPLVFWLTSPVRIRKPAEA